MDEHTHHDLIDQIHKASTNVQGVIGIEKCWARKNGMSYVVDLHLEIDGDLSVTEGHGI